MVADDFETHRQRGGDDGHEPDRQVDRRAHRRRAQRRHAQVPVRRHAHLHAQTRSRTPALLVSARARLRGCRGRSSRSKRGCVGRRGRRDRVQSRRAAPCRPKADVPALHELDGVEDVPATHGVFGHRAPSKIAKTHAGPPVTARLAPAAVAPDAAVPPARRRHRRRSRAHAARHAHGRRGVGGARPRRSGRIAAVPRSAPRAPPPRPTR